MDCNKTNALMMDYMDGILTENDALQLNQHLSNCSQCQKDFELYDQLLSELETCTHIDMVTPPEHFELCVMEKINTLPDLYKQSAIALENIACWVWGSFSVLAGVGFLLFINQETLFDYVYANPTLASFAATLTPVSQYVSDFVANYWNIVQSGLLTILYYAANWRYILLSVCVLLALLQMVLYKKDKAELK